MSLFLGKTASNKAKLHITSDARDITYLKEENGPTSLFDTSQQYLQITLVETCTPTFGDAGVCGTVPIGQTFYFLRYNNTTNIVTDNSTYIAISRDAYTNEPIIYRKYKPLAVPLPTDGLVPSQLVYGTGSLVLPKGPGYTQCGTLVYYLGSSANNYVPPNYYPELKIYKVEPIDFSAYQSILAGNSDIQFYTGSVYESLLDHKLVGYGNLVNVYDEYGLFEDGLTGFQILGSSTDTLQLLSDKIIGTYQGQPYEIFGNSSSSLLKGMEHSYPADSTLTWSIPMPVSGMKYLKWKLWTYDVYDGWLSYDMIWILIPTDTTTSIVSFKFYVNTANGIEYQHMYYDVVIANGTATLTLSPVVSTGASLSSLLKMTNKHIINMSS